MAWQVGLVLDEITEPGPLLGWLPIWARSTPERQVVADELRKDWNSCWAPEPAFNLINVPLIANPVEITLALIPTIETHHDRMTALRLFGLEDSAALEKGMNTLGYTSRIINPAKEWLLFFRPMDELNDVPLLNLNAASWKDGDDVYDAFFDAVRAPDWHGRNLDALNDSISTGGINKIEVPYRLNVNNISKAGLDVRKMTEQFSQLIMRIGAQGCPVEMRVVE